MEYTESFFAERGKHHYTLSEDSLLISGRRENITLPLKDFEPEFRTVHRRSPGFYVGLTGAVIAVLLAVTAEAQPDLIEHPVALAVITAAISALCLLASWRKVEFAVFNTTRGHLALAIARSGPDSAKFPEFVEVLSRRIRHAKEGVGS